MRQRKHEKNIDLADTTFNERHSNHKEISNISSNLRTMCTIMKIRVETEGEKHGPNNRVRNTKKRFMTILNKTYVFYV